MKPVNQSARAAAIRRFLLIYGISLLAILACAWVIFVIPSGLFKETIQKYKATEQEQTQLVGKIDGMTINLKNIMQTDQTYLSSSNEIEKGTLLANLQEYQKKINDALVEVKNDSARLISTNSKKDAYNYIIAFNAILSYRNTLSSLQKTLAEKGGESAELVKVQSQLETCQSQLDLFKALAAQKPAPPPPSGGGGGGGKGKEKEAELQRLLDDCRADLDMCVKTKGSAIPPVVPDDAKKAVVYFEAGESLYTTATKTKNLIEKRGILTSAKLMYDKAKTGSTAEKARKQIEQIDAELKRLRNIG
jgi:hypothetical protein